MPDRENWIKRIASVDAEGRIPVIAEIKPSSPASGDLVRDRSITDIAQAYVDGGAACLSVVTGRWFGGNLSMLAQVAETTTLPLLRKDLIVNVDQIKQSRDHGANAVLLTRKILSVSHLEKMIDMALGLGITPFVEVAGIEEIDGLQKNDDIVIAITNRDIAQKETDIDSGLRSLELIDDGFRIGGALVSASGINTPSDARALHHAGFDGLLIGTALLNSDNPAQVLRAFTEARG